MTIVHTTIQPDVALEVDAAELAWLTRWDLLAAPGADLYCQWYAYPDGPPALVTPGALVITDDGEDVVATVAADTLRSVGDGLYYYRWPAASQPGAGTYTATWSATDAGGVAITASESFTV